MRDNRPLAGVRVIDAATYIAAPFCATLLAEFGAEVIKVEMPGVGDPLRAFGHVTEAGDSLIWLSEGRNKKSVTIDLRTKQGADIFKKLSKKCDVICENFQTGTLEKWGVGYETLKALNPGLIMMRITGYGQTGPYAGRPGFGRIGNAFGGLSYLAGYPDRAPVTPGSATLPDYLSGVFGAFGVMLALRARERTGEGQVIDIGLYEPIFRILDELAPAYDRFGIVRERMGPGTVNAVPHSHYQTRDGRWGSNRLHERPHFRPPGGADGPSRDRRRRQVRQSRAARGGARRARRRGSGLGARRRSRRVAGTMRPSASAVRATLFDRRNLQGPAISGATEHRRGRR